MLSEMKSVAKLSVAMLGILVLSVACEETLPSDAEMEAADKLVEEFLEAAREGKSLEGLVDADFVNLVTRSADRFGPPEKSSMLRVYPRSAQYVVYQALESRGEGSVLIGVLIHPSSRPEILNVSFVD